MRILLDTHIVLWVLADAPRLSEQARSTLGRADAIFVSPVSIWEMRVKAGIGKLRLPPIALPDALTETGFRQLPVTWDHADGLAELPDIHRDPFDRLLIAQAMREPLRFLTADRALEKYSSLVQLV